MIDEIQLLDWFGRDEKRSSDDENSTEEEEVENVYGNDEDDYYKKKSKNKSFIQNEYIVYLFGRVPLSEETSENVSIKVVNFTPFFWIELPERFKEYHKRIYLDHLLGLLPDYLKKEFDMKECSVREKYKFKGYQWNKKKKFMQLAFKSKRALNKMYILLKDLVTIPSVLERHKFSVYEKNIDPILRLIHLKNIKPSGWIKIDSKYIQMKTKTHREYKCNWEKIIESEKTNIGPIKIGSFDIECDSSHGDFPLAKKDYYKLALNIVEGIKQKQKDKKSKCTITRALVGKWIKCGFRNYKNKTFSLQDTLDIQTIFLKNEKDVPSDSLIEEVATKCVENYPKLNKEDVCKTFCNYFNEYFPAVAGDKVIQIGTVFYDYGNISNKYKKYIVTLDTCDSIDNTIVIPCKTVKEVIENWVNLMITESPNVLTGYNIFGFDFKFLWECAEENNCSHLLKKLGQLKTHETKMIHKELTSSALGHNDLYYFDTPGLILIDLLKVIQRDHNLSSYKLDNVSVEFINGIVTEIKRIDSLTRVYTKSIFSLSIGQYIIIQESSIVGKKVIGNKRKIIGIASDYIDVEYIDNDELLCLDEELIKSKSYSWAVGKDDVSVQDIFKFQNQDSKSRAVVAKYCIQDCELCISLLRKLDIVSSSMAMSNVTLIPWSFIFMRGQMIKTLSLVSSECRKLDYLLPELPPPREDIKESYEGAEVLEPMPGIYIDQPVTVLDYGSLYPSSMISGNLSHCTIITELEYQGEEGAKKLETLGIKFEDVEYDNYINVLTGKTWKKEIHSTEKRKICRYILPKLKENGEVDDESRGIIPKILMKLLAARKATKKLMKTESDPFRYSVLNGIQNAQKITCNSVYGGIGANVSALYFPEIAASTTAIGRQMLHLAKDFSLKRFPQAEVIYGDTDSIFVKFNPKGENNEDLKGKEAIKKCIEMGFIIENEIQGLLKFPHKLELEKQFSPYIQLGKKKYLGHKYENTTDNYKQISMGSVLTRRDNAPIVKKIYDDVIKKIMEDQDIDGAVKSVKKNLKDVIDGKFPMEYFIISKTLRSEYKIPESIVHKVLADRIKERSPGSEPKSNDRVQYAFVRVKNLPKNSKQGERVETPDYIIENKLKLDYGFYISNQIAKPVSQVFGLCLDNLRKYGYDLSPSYFENIEKKLKKDGKSQSFIREKIQEKKNQTAEKILFEEIINIEYQKNLGQPLITRYFNST
jgi:DNA polymerase elongation subunit (family B)